MTNQVEVPVKSLSKRNQPITRSEWQWVISWSAVTLLLSLAPFVFAWLTAPAGTQFMGLIFNATDGNSYLVKMQEGREGSWLFHLIYSPEHDAGAFIFLPYLLLGRLAGLLNLSNIVVYHLARLICGLALLLVSYRFISWFFSDTKQRQLAFLLICFGGGIGWLLLPFVGTSSTDMWVAESLSFFSILVAPHYSLATALLLLGILWVAKAFEGETIWRNFGKAATATFILGWVHPFLVVSLGAVTGVFLLRLCWQQRQLMLAKWLGLMAVGVLGLPGPVYTFIATNSDPVLRTWMAQNQTLSPEPWFYLTGYGLILVLAVLGGWKIERADYPENSTEKFWQQRFRLLTTWAIVTAILLYIPVSFQRRFVEGLQMPLVCLAVYGFYEVFWTWYKRNHPKARIKRWTNYLIQLSAISTIVIVLILIIDVTARGEAANDTPAHPLYYYNGEIAALNWLATNTGQDDTVITGPIDGNYIPARTGNRVFYGHELETIDIAQKGKLLAQFFDANTPQSFREQLIKDYNLHYLYYGLEEKHLLGDKPEFDPAQTNWPVVFQNQWVTIYKLN